MKDSLRRSWMEFWFREEPPLAVALYRIMFGLLVLMFCLLLAPDLLTWFGKDGAVSVEAARRFHQEGMVDVFFLTQQSDQDVRMLFGIFTAAAVALTLGLCTRTSAFIVFLGMSSFQHRDWLIMNSGDTFMRLAALYLTFSNAGKALSLDRLIELWTRTPPPLGAAKSSAPWVQRLLQVQLAMLYCQAFLTKIVGPMWLDGSAVYYVTRLEDFQRHPLPSFLNNQTGYKLLSWYTLATEFALWTVIWVKKYRYQVLLAGIILHLGIDWTMNLPLFEYLMITPYILFVPASDLQSLRNKLSNLLQPHLGPSLVLLFDGGNLNAARAAETLRRFDCLSRLQIIDLTEESTKALWHELIPDVMTDTFISFTTSGAACQWRAGTAALVAAVGAILAPFWPLSYLNRRDRVAITR